MPFPVLIVVCAVLLLALPVWYALRGAIPWLRNLAMGIVVIGVPGLAIYIGVNLPSSTNNRVVYSPNASISHFDNATNDNDTEGWQPFSDEGIYIKTSDLNVVHKKLDGIESGMLQYSLNLQFDRTGTLNQRNAVYYPMDKGKVIGIIANVYYESDFGSSDKMVYGGFFANGTFGFTEDYLKKLEPNKWNTLVWSLFGPVYWDMSDTEVTEKWQAFKDLIWEPGNYLHPGNRLDEVALDRIGIQFFVGAKDNPEKFNGTVYIDNIILIYRP